MAITDVEPNADHSYIMMLSCLNYDLLNNELDRKSVGSYTNEPVGAFTPCDMFELRSMMAKSVAAKQKPASYC